MSDSHSVTLLLQMYRDGNDQALVELLKRYYEAVRAHATRQVESRLRRIIDADEVANGVFYRIAERLRDPDKQDIEGRCHLWRLMRRLVITEVNDQRKAEYAEKRDARERRGESMFYPESSEVGRGAGLADVAFVADSPSAMAQTMECFQAVYDSLPNDEFRDVLERMLLLRSNQEVMESLNMKAYKLSRIKKFIERKIEEQMLED